jgi:hypothetical protein
MKNNRKATQGRNYFHKPQVKLIGTAIMLRHGSKNYEKAKLQRDPKTGQVLNRLAFVPFEYQTNPSVGREKNHTRCNNALIRHYNDVDKECEKFKDFDWYTLKVKTYSSIKIKRNA